MDNLYTASLIQRLNLRDEIFICGPAPGNTSNPDNHLRVYANGGILCLLPTTPDSVIDISSLAYLNKAEESQDENDLRVKYNNSKKIGGRDKVNEKNRERADILKNDLWLQILCDAIEKHFSKPNVSAEKSSSEEKILAAKRERHNQIAIARKHQDFHPDHRGTVVCDLEMTLPKAWYKRGSRSLQIPGKTQAQCDLVTFSCAEKPWVISIVELKCGKKACKRPKNGLSAHAKEMALSMEETRMDQGHIEAVHNRTDYIKEILRRLGYMLKAGLLENVPTGLEAQVCELSNSEDREWIQSQVRLRSCFLFTGDDDIKDAMAAANLCQKADYLNTHLRDFCYQFQKDPECVDLSQMQSWDEFIAGMSFPAESS